MIHKKRGRERERHVDVLGRCAAALPWTPSSDSCYEHTHRVIVSEGRVFDFVVLHIMSHKHNFNESCFVMLRRQEVSGHVHLVMMINFGIGASPMYRIQV